MDEKEEKFRDMSGWSKTVVIILILTAVLIMFGVFVLGFNGLFIIFGVEYQSIWSLVLYTGFYFLFGSIADLAAKLVIHLVMTRQRSAGSFRIFLITIIIDTGFAWLVLHTIDEFMTTINVPVWTEILIALIIALLDYFFDEEKKE